MIRDGFIRVAASTPEVNVADVEYNREQVCEQIEEGRKKGASIMVFPELVLTGYTCGELFIQKSLLAKAREEIRKLIAFTSGDTMLVFVGLPWEYNNKLYNVAAAIQDGKLLGLVPKRWIPNYSEFYEGRYFNPGWEKTIDVSWDGSRRLPGRAGWWTLLPMPTQKSAPCLCCAPWRRRRWNALPSAPTPEGACRDGRRITVPC